MHSTIRTLAALIAAGIAVLVTSTAPAFAGANGGAERGHDSAVSASCTVSGDMVYATGLPADQVINFLVTDSSGTWGWVLGYTLDGTWGVLVPAQNGSTTYQFISETWGPDGSKYNVFATC